MCRRPSRHLVYIRLTLLLLRVLKAKYDACLKIAGIVSQHLRIVISDIKTVYSTSVTNAIKSIELT